MLNILSIGFLACRFQCSTLFIMDAAHDLEIEPAAIINDVVHYSDVDAVRIGTHVRDGLSGLDDIRRRAAAKKTT